jgi:short-subunit dehydrogenase
MNTSPYRAAIFGATSAIAVELLRAIVRDGPAEFLLIGRDSDKLAAVAADLAARGATCQTRTADFLDPTTDWQGLLATASAPWDLFLIAHGSLCDQEPALAQGADIAREIAINFTSHATIAGACSAVLRRQGRGTLAAIGSVAGDRGRQSNFLYGSAKAGLATFMAGLRHRHAGEKEIRVILLKPGMTDSPMTAGMKKGPLFSSASSVGALGWRAIRRGTPVAYLPGWWRWIMLLIRSVPAAVFHRTKL